MPVVGTTAYNTAGQITSLVRSLLNDAAGNLFTDAVLLPYVNSAYRKTQRALANVQSGTFISEDALLVVPAVSLVDSSVQVSITDATAAPNQLPSNLLVPVKLWERANLSSDDFVEMTDLTDHDGLPSEPQVEALRFWEWRADGLYFLGATQDTQIRLRYQAGFPDLVDATSSVLIRNAQEALAYAAAAMAGLRGGRRRRSAGMWRLLMRWRTWWCARRRESSRPGDGGGRFPRGRDLRRLFNAGFRSTAFRLRIFCSSNSNLKTFAGAKYQRLSIVFLRITNLCHLRDERCSNP